MSYVLVIEPQQGQAGVLRHVGREARTSLRIVDSIADGLQAIDNEIPQLVLASALMSPRDEHALLSRLRDLPHGTAPQVLVIPALTAPDAPQPKRELFRIGRSRRVPPPPAVCEPSAFANQLSMYLDDADRRRYESWRPSLEPETKAGRERRAALRFDRLRWARAAVDGSPVNLVDLSLTGAQILTPRLLEPGHSVRVLLSGEGDSIRCEAGVVWGESGTLGPANTQWCRAGMTFKDVDRDAFERFYFRGN
jgi:CheY-like chemotaxis protein